MNITVLVLCLLAVAGGAVADAVTAQTKSPRSGSESLNYNTKRDSNEQTATPKADVQGYATGRPPLPPQYYSNYAFAAPGPQIFFAKPEGGVQYAAPNAYRAPVIAPGQIFIPQFALPQAQHHGTEGKPAGPLPIAYAHPGQVQYAILAPQPGSPYVPFHGPQIQLALAPIQQPVNPAVKGGVTYAAPVPQLAFLAAPQQPIVHHSAPVIAAAPHHQAGYSYSIQPSVEIASAKQVISPTTATPHYKQVTASPATSYATFSQQLPSATSVPSIKIPSQVYPTPGTQLSTNSKVFYRSLGPSLQDAAFAFGQPGGFHYGSHLYNPSIARLQSIFASQKFY